MPWAARLITFAGRRDSHCFVLHAAFGFFSLFALFLTFHHVPWRDEAQAWLMARDLSPWGLFVEARHDGHPILWHLSLKALQFLGADYRGMLLLNWSFIVLAVALLFYASSLPLVVRLAVALCPACLLHISYIARNYAIAVFLIFLAAALYRRVDKHPILYALVLALIDNTNSYAAATSAGLALQFLLEQTSSIPERPFSLRPLYTRYLVPNLIIVFGALLLVAQLVPIRLQGDPLHSPPFLPHEVAPWPLCIFTICAGFAFLRKRNGFPYIVGGILSALLALIPACFYICGTRHAFMLVAEIIYFVWVYFDDFRPLSGPGPYARAAAKWLPSFSVIFAAFICQPYGVRMAFNRASYSDEAARAIIARGLDRPDTLLVTTNPTFVTPLLLYFQNIKNTYGVYPFGPDPQSYADFLRTRMRTTVPSLEQVKPLIARLAGQNPGKPIVVVSVDTPDDDLAQDPNFPLTLLYASGPPPRETGEAYRVYQWQQTQP